MDSLREYVLVAQTKMQVEHFVRRAKRKWSLTIYTEPTEEVYFPALGCRLTLAQIYEMAQLPALKLLPGKNQKNAKQRG